MIILSNNKLFNLPYYSNINKKLYKLNNNLLFKALPQPEDFILLRSIFNFTGDFVIF